MEYLTQTPFGRPVTAGLLAHQHLAKAELANPSLGKWDIFHSLCAARTAFALTDRDMAVLNALLTFYPGDTLEDGAGLIVFPSNATLSERAHGMAESTLRRHLAALVRAGVILRHDSPNGKRYAARGAGGAVIRAFGFSLRPLLVRADEFQEAADRLRAAQAAYKRRREACVLILRDARNLTAYGLCEAPSEIWCGYEARCADLARMLRRKLTLEDLDTIEAVSKALLADVQAAITPHKTKEMSGNDVNIERHHHNSKPNLSESEPCLEKSREAVGTPPIPLAVVLKACAELQTYAPGPIRHWDDLVRAADIVRPMMGISTDAWQDACQAMGAANAAVTTLCMLERMADIRSPGGYLRSLTARAKAGQFSPGPMVMALLNTGNRVAA